jgi:hypothetical protein
VRISFGYHEALFCDKCHTENHWQDTTELKPEPTRGYTELCAQILRQNQPIKVEILDYAKSEYKFITKTILSSTFPNLLMIQALKSHIRTTEITGLIEICPSFRHSLAKWLWAPDGMAPLKSPILTTLDLSLTNLSQPSRRLTHEELHLLALRHLYIRYPLYNEPTEYEEPYWLPILRLIGNELRTLHLPWERKLHGDIPGEI